MDTSQYLRGFLAANNHWFPLTWMERFPAMALNRVLPHVHCVPALGWQQGFQRMMTMLHESALTAAQAFSCFLIQRDEKMALLPGIQVLQRTLTKILITQHLSS